MHPRTTVFSRVLKSFLPRIAVVVGVAIPLTFQGCVNIFDPLDSPSGDAQLLSAARACFDKGDFSCAREFYGKLGANEDAIAELAFVKLDEQGAGIGDFVLALDAGKSGAVGMILTVLAERMATGAGATKRAAILSAYQASNSITRTELKGFVQFMSAIAMAAEILAELPGTQADKILQQETDIVTVAATCRAAGAGGCAAAASCANTSGFNWSNTPAALASAGTVAADWDTFQGAIDAASTGLTNMNVSNSTSQAFSLATNLITLLGTVAADERCMQYALVTTGIGVGR